MNFEDTPSHASLLRGLFLHNLSWSLSKPAYSTMVAEKFQIYSVKITGKYICVLKNWIPSFLLINLRQEEITHSSRTAFSEDLFFPSRKGDLGKGVRDYGNEKITKIKPTRALVTSSHKFHHICNLFIFSFHFVVPWFSFNHAEMGRFFNLTNKILTKKYNNYMKYTILPNF